ncbi:hypothetical protein D3C84_1176860 [compost metagenome]
MATAPETVIFVQLAGADMDFGLGFLGRRSPGLTGEHRAAQRRGAGQYGAGHRTGP